MLVHRAKRQRRGRTHEEEHSAHAASAFGKSACPDLATRDESADETQDKDMRGGVILHYYQPPT